VGQIPWLPDEPAVTEIFHKFTSTFELVFGVPTILFGHPQHRQKDELHANNLITT